MTCITGVSGSGKSSLAKGILYPALRRLLFVRGSNRAISTLSKATFSTLSFGRNGRSEPDRQILVVEPRDLHQGLRRDPQTHADRPYAQRSGFNPRTSFNIAGGRCEEVRARDSSRSACHSWPTELVCEACERQAPPMMKFSSPLPRNRIYDILEMTVDDAIAFWR